MQILKVIYVCKRHYLSKCILSWCTSKQLISTKCYATGFTIGSCFFHQIFFTLFPSNCKTLIYLQISPYLNSCIGFKYFVESLLMVVAGWHSLITVPYFTIFCFEGDKYCGSSKCNSGNSDIQLYTNTSLSCDKSSAFDKSKIWCEPY